HPDGSESMVRQVTSGLFLWLLTQASIEPGGGPAYRTEIPAFLQEPSYFIERKGDKWAVKKPRLRVMDPLERRSSQAWTILEDSYRPAAERRMNSLPRLRLNCALVEFNPVTRRRTLISDWKDQSDAQEIAADIHILLDRFAPPAAKALYPSI